LIGLYHCSGLQDLSWNCERWLNAHVELRSDGNRGPA
jgi:hypothetical protein